MGNRVPEEEKTLIMKFGGAAVSSPENFSKIAERIIKKSLEYSRIAIVVSAMGDMTDQLISLAYLVHPNPPKREYDMLVSVGERISISLLAMALAVQGKEAVSFTGSQSGIITSDHHSEAQIIEVRPYRLEKSLQEGKVVIVAGFQGVSETKEITTLGRGGSDMTAVALGVALRAEKVEFYKDVPGIYELDPAVTPSPICPELTYEEAARIVKNTGGQVLYPAAIALAEKHDLPLHILPFDMSEEKGTKILNSIQRNTIFSYT